MVIDRVGSGSVTFRVIPDSSFSCVCPLELFVNSVNPLTYAVEGGERKFSTLSIKSIASLAGTAAGSVALSVPVVEVPWTKLQAEAS